MGYNTNFFQILIAFLFGILSIGSLIYLEERYESEEQIETHEYGGLNIRNASEQQAIDRAYALNPNADWVVINVKNMTYEKIIDICVHEASHELFAKGCENNPEMCLELAEELK